MQWELITNIILITSIIILAVFACLSLYQWITRKSLKKVDQELLWFPLPLVIMAVVYIVFDKIIVLATRPNGSGEPSFPSTHVMVVATIFFLITIILPKYIKNKVMRFLIEIIIVALISLTCAGRILSNMHSMGDVIAGLIFAFVFSEIYYLAIKKGTKNAKHLHENNKR